MSAKIFCEILFGNLRIQEKVCEIFNFTSFAGKIIINSWPIHLKQKLKTNKGFFDGKHKIIDLLRNIKIYTNYSHSSIKYWCFPEFKKNNTTLEQNIAKIKQHRENSDAIQFCKF